MAKAGILHDYDLMANKQDSAQNQTCVVCDVKNMVFQWSDYNGEGMCTQCGCAYQLMNGSDNSKVEGNYPYLSMKEDSIPLLREFWQDKKIFVCFGSMMGPRPGVKEFNEWIEKNHPEIGKET